MRRFGYASRALAAGALLVGLAGVQPAGVLAATDTVSVCDDSGAAGTLRNVIANATAGDTVNFACSGTITLGSTIELSKNLTLWPLGWVERSSMPRIKAEASVWKTLILSMLHTNGPGVHGRFEKSSEATFARVLSIKQSKSA